MQVLKDGSLLTFKFDPTCGAWRGWLGDEERPVEELAGGLPFPLPLSSEGWRVLAATEREREEAAKAMLIALADVVDGSGGLLRG